MATHDYFEYEQLSEEWIKDDNLASFNYCQSENVSQNKKIPVTCDRITVEMKNFNECDYIMVDEIKKIHEWHDKNAGYVYLKEKIIGKTGRNEKKNNFYWLETNELYLDNMRSAVKTDRDYWISAAEVSWPLTDGDKPLLREKWIKSMPCHFLILDLVEAVGAENLNLDFNLSGEQMTELILEHCRHRGLPEPIIWGDHEELAVVWPLVVPYRKGRNSFLNNRGNEVFNKFAFNLDWNDVQDLLYKDFEYLGANPKKKHALTLLRVPGTFNTHANAPVRVFHEAEKSTLKDFEVGLNYIRDRVKRYKPLRHPDFQENLKEFQKANEEFLNFWNEIDGTDTTAEKVVVKPKKKKSKSAVSKSEKAKERRERQDSINTSINKKNFSAICDKITELKNNFIGENYTTNIKNFLAELNEELGTIGAKPEIIATKNIEADSLKPDKYKKFLDQIRQDVLQIHKASENFVCLCVKSRNGYWQQIFVQSRNLEKRLIDLFYDGDFDSKNIYVSQAKFLDFRSRAIDNVASLSVSFLDIDGKFATERKDLTPEEWSNLIVEHCNEKEIPLPSIIVFSGNGLHVKWLYRKAITREKLERWTMLQRKLWLIFKDFGADAQAKDAARVLRVPGTKNCKPETADRDVRVVYSNPERYSFEDFAKKIFSMTGYDESQELCEEFKTTAKPKVAKVEAPAPAPKQKPKPTKAKSEQKIKKSRPTPPSLYTQTYTSPYFKVKNETTGEERFVKSYEVPDYLNSQAKTHLLSRSISDFEQPDLKAVGRIYCNYAVLSAAKVPGANLKEKAMSVVKRCSEYWNGLGMQLPNAIMLLNGKLIVAWKYFDYLPGVALPRWMRTQEIIGYHFKDWGARDEAEYQDNTALLPIAEFTNKKAEILKLNARYKFDDMASRILRYTQDEVKEYKKKKAAEKAKAQAGRDLKNLASFKRKPKKRSGSFAGMAVRRFNDIVKLMELRADSHGEVPQGHRELSVFWAMVFAVQGGLVSNMQDFDALNQKLIDANGVQFHVETKLKTFSSVKKRYLNDDLYHAKTETLIEQLGITIAEQLELDVLRFFPKKEKKEKKQSIESQHPWTYEGISRRTWYRRRSEKLKALALEEMEKINALISKIFEEKFTSKTRLKTKFMANGTTFSYIMRGRGRQFHVERECLFFFLGLLVRVIYSGDDVANVGASEKEKRWIDFEGGFFLRLNERMLFRKRGKGSGRCESETLVKISAGALHPLRPLRLDFISALAVLIRPPPIFRGDFWEHRIIRRKEVLLE